MKFVDEAKLKVQAGNGGRGSVSFRREKFVPFGGPDGGDGGHRRQRLAACGARASTRWRTFASSAPSRRGPARAARATTAPGAAARTLHRGAGRHAVVSDADTERTARRSDNRGGQELKVAQGGKGGWGNTRFKSSTNRAPRQFGPGLPGERRTLGTRAQGDRRCRPARAAECRQIDADPRALGGAAEGGRLSLHHAVPESRRGLLRRASQLRHGRYSGADRGRGGRRGAGHSIPEASAAHACAVAYRGYAAAGPGSRSGTRCARHRRGAQEIR